MNGTGNFRSWVHRGLTLVLLAIVVWGGAMLSVSSPTQAASTGVPMPDPKIYLEGAKCVEPVDVIRREHMNFLKHQRDETVKDGIRGAKYSLRQCIECHALPDPKAAGKRTVREFCGSCHQYAAVSIDCFECHTNQAETAKLMGPMPSDHPGLEKTVSMLGGQSRHANGSLMGEIEGYLNGELRMTPDERRSGYVQQCR